MPAQLCFLLLFFPLLLAADDLRDASSFDTIANRSERSRALFLEATHVMFSPRCLNCHPRGDSPHQGDDMQVHYPTVTRGPKDQGVPAMMCVTCHQDHNVETARVPGAPKWHLAPKIMAWEGATPHSLCEQLKDPKRNGGRKLSAIVEHGAHDELVGWGWHPGADRLPAPGTQEKFGRLLAAWVETGAECPKGKL